MIRKGFVGIAGAMFVTAMLSQAYVGAQSEPAKKAPAKSTDQQKAAPAKADQEKAAPAKKAPANPDAKPQAPPAPTKAAPAPKPTADEKVMAGGGSIPAKTPTSQPATGAADEPKVGPATLMSVHIPKPVMADGKTLAAGTYQVRLTEQTAGPVKGTTTSEERWVEFLQGGQVKGREIATVLTNSEAKVIAKQGLPSGAAKVENLIGNEYLRVWINKGGTNYLVHLKNS